MFSQRRMYFRWCKCMVPIEVWPTSRPVSFRAGPQSIRSILWGVHSLDISYPVLDRGSAWHNLPWLVAVEPHSSPESVSRMLGLQSKRSFLLCRLLCCTKVFQSLPCCWCNPFCSQVRVGGDARSFASPSHQAILQLGIIRSLYYCY